MITDERDLAERLRTVDAPPGLTLDPEHVVARARRTDRRRRTGRGAVAAGSVAAVAATALWATGTPVGPIGVLPAAPWTDVCEGIVDGPGGTSINLDKVSYAEVPVALWPSAPEGETVVALDRCTGGGARVAFALRGPDGRLTRIEAPFRYSSGDLEAVRSGRQVQAGLVTLSEKDSLHFGVVGAAVTDLRFLSRSGSPVLYREPLPGTGLHGYLAQAGAAPEHTLGVAWSDPLGSEHVQWLNVLDVVTFEVGPGENPPLVAQDRQGSWNLWLPGATEEHGHTRVEDLGGSISAEAEDGSFEHLALLREGIHLEVEDGPSAVIRYAESADGGPRFAWAEVPPGATLFEVDAEGQRLNAVSPVREP